MNILLIGAGSIGKRHIANLLSLGYNNISVVTRFHLPGELSHLITHKTIAAALQDSNFDVAFICTPTALHIENLLLLLEKQIKNIYIEKPLSHTVENIKQVLTLAATYNNNIVVGYDLHFDPGIQKLHELLQAGTIGKVISVNAFVGQYLPHWRPYEDHRTGMSAKKATGGGVLLDIVHEFDYLYWLNGPAETVAGLNVNTGTLEIETEEVAEVIIKYTNGSIGTIHLDYMQPSLVRYCIITGAKGSITCNMADKKVTWALQNGDKGEFSYETFERNDRFKEIIKHFLENKNDYRLTSLQKSLESLYIVEAAKYSSANNCMVNLQNFKTN